MCVGDCKVDVFPSPKFQSQLSIVDVRKAQCSMPADQKAIMDAIGVQVNGATYTDIALDRINKMINKLLLNRLASGYFTDEVEKRESRINRMLNPK